MSENSDSAGNDTPASTVGRELVVTRRFKAPRDLVFDMWTDPKHISQWWGPTGFSTTTQSFDFRPGGVWKHVMHGPDGTDYDNEVHYVEIVRPERIVYNHVSAPHFQSSATFTDIDGQTEMTFKLVFATPEDCRRVAIEHGAAKGLRETVNRLGLYVNAQSAALVITRTLDAPRDLVWRAWTERQRLIDWFGPKGVPIVSATLDLTPGGAFHYCMRLPDGGDMWGKWIFLAVDPPRRLMWESAFSDPAGNVTRAPFSGTWPLKTMSTVSFDEADGRTTVTLNWWPLNATPEEIATFTTGHDSMRGGWGGTFDGLDAYLKSE